MSLSFQDLCFQRAGDHLVGVEKNDRHTSAELKLLPKLTECLTDSEIRVCACTLRQVSLADHLIGVVKVGDSVVVSTDDSESLH